MQGFVDIVNENFVAGWAYNSTDEALVVIEVFIGGTLVATTVADLPRPDIERSYNRRLAGFRATLNLPPELRATFVPTAVRVFGLSEYKRHPIPRSFGLAEETAIEIDEMGSGFWMFGENLFRGLVVDVGEGADEVVGVTRDDAGACQITLKSGRHKTVRPDEKVRVVPETFAGAGAALG